MYRPYVATLNSCSSRAKTFDLTITVLIHIGASNIEMISDLSIVSSTEKKKEIRGGNGRLLSWCRIFCVKKRLMNQLR